jgi:hypothetical protein
MISHFGFPLILANAGTVLMWATAGWLLIGNLFIGLGEGMLLARLTKCSGPRACIIMIAANYASAWLAAWLHPWTMFPFTLEAGVWWLTGAWLATFVFTVIVEWPLVRLILRKEAGLKKAFVRSLQINACSYAVLTACFALVGPTSLLWQTHRVRLVEIPVVAAKVFFISPDRLSVQCLSLPDGTVSKLAELPSPADDDTGNYDRLFWQTAQTGEGSDLWLTRRSRADQIKLQVLRNFIGKVILPDPARKEIPDMWFNLDAADLRPGQNGPWEAKAGFWAAEGLRLRKSDGKFVRLALETPFAQLYVRAVTMLADDKVIFQAGNEICLLDCETLRLTILANGYGATVLLPGK